MSTPKLSKERVSVQIRDEVLKQLSVSVRSGYRVTEADVEKLIERCLQTLRPEQLRDFFFVPNPWFNNGTAMALLCYGNIQLCFDVLDAWDAGVYL